MLRLLLAFAFLPLTSLAADFDAYINNFYLAEHRLDELDAQIAKEARASRPGLLSRSRAYRDLLALRILRDALARDISAEYEKLASASSPELEKLHERLRAFGPAERLALSDLVKTLPAPPGRALPVFYADTAQYLRAREASASLRAGRVKLALKDKALLAKVEDLAATIDVSHLSRADKIRPGAGPEGNVSGAQFPAGTFALTFDDGPFENYSEQIFGHLAKYGKKASFFWATEHLERFPKIAPKAIAAGLPTNNHSWTHLNLDKATDAVRKHEINEAVARQAELTLVRPSLFRLPYGAGVSNAAVRKLIADLGLIHVMWNIDSIDWQDKDPAKILARVKQLMATEKRGILLFHDIHPQSAEAARLLLEWSAGLNGGAAHRWVTIPDIIDELNKAREVSGESANRAKARAGNEKNAVDSGANL